MACGYLTDKKQKESLCISLWNYTEISDKSRTIEDVSNRTLEIGELPNKCQMVGSNIITIEGDDRCYSLVQRSFWP